MQHVSRMLALLIGAAAIAMAQPASAQHHYGGHYGGYRGGASYYHGGYGRGGWAIGLGLGIGIGTLAYGSYYYGPYVYPGYVVVQEPAPVTYVTPAQPLHATPPDPVIYPRNGQSAAQTEADRQACNRFAVTVPSAMADASVFQRAIEACMDARGYTVK